MTTTYMNHKDIKLLKLLNTSYVNKSAQFTASLANANIFLDFIISNKSIHL